MADEPLTWQPEDVVAGKYRLVRVLGEGGMGIVYEAHHVRLRQRLAIKMVRPVLATRNNIVLRFEREARAAAQLRSVHAAKVIDVDATADGVPYIVMEFLEGQSLSSLLEAEHRLGIQDVIGWVLETCCAIGEAHDLGIVHRDLKPSNLFLASESGRSVVKVLDFGISKLADESETSLTTTQVTLGTPNYMSPEQVRSAREVDARTDVWSLGVILYELLTGQVPFKGTSPSAVLAAIVADPVSSMLELRPDIPRGLDAVVLKALSKRAGDRYGDVRALAAALTPFAKLDPFVTAELAEMMKGGSRVTPPAGSLSLGKGEPDVTAAAPTAPGWSKITAVTAGSLWPLTLGALLALAALGWYARSTFQRRPPDTTAATAPPPVALTAPPLPVSSPPPASPPTAQPAPSAVAAVGADAGVSASAAPSNFGWRKVKSPKPPASSPNTSTVPPPALSSNPLHL
jgi:serine/threonine-protein kinase